MFYLILFFIKLTNNGTKMNGYVYDFAFAGKFLQNVRVSNNLKKPLRIVYLRFFKDRTSKT